MTTWSMDQVRQARGVYARAILDPTALSRARIDLMEAARRKMFKSMVATAHPFAIELHPDDIQFREDPHEFGIAVTSWWEPQTNEVELRGGPADGTVLAFASAPHGSIKLPQVEAIDWQRPATEPVVSTLRLEYRCSGWSETSRRWIYSPPMTRWRGAT